MAKTTPHPSTKSCGHRKLINKLALNQPTKSQTLRFRHTYFLVIVAIERKILPPTVSVECPANRNQHFSMQRVECCTHHVCLSVDVARSSVACVLPIGFLSCHKELIAPCVEAGSTLLRLNQSAETRRLFSAKVPQLRNL